MKTIIFDIDGTITNMWPIEKSVLLYLAGKTLGNEIEELKKSGILDTYKIFLKVSGQRITKQKYFKLYDKAFSALLKNGQLPLPKKYPIVRWIIANRAKYHFVYATGGRRAETRYVLRQFGLACCVDFEYSIDKTNCRFSKKTGIPFKKIKSLFKDCLLISDGSEDCDGAMVAGIPFVLVTPEQTVNKIFSSFLSKCGGKGTME